VGAYESVTIYVPSDSMTTSEYKIRFYIGRQMIMAAVIACLCLSAGEGLRLSPFTVSDLDTAAAKTRQVCASGPNAISTNYNPTTVPTRTLKRGKEQVAYCEKSTSQISRGLAAKTLLLSAPIGAKNLVSLILNSRIPSRAPPLVS